MKTPRLPPEYPNLPEPQEPSKPNRYQALSQEDRLKWRAVRERISSATSYEERVILFDQSQKILGLPIFEDHRIGVLANRLCRLVILRLWQSVHATICKIHRLGISPYDNGC